LVIPEVERISIADIELLEACGIQRECPVGGHVRRGVQLVNSSAAIEDF
jgi:hypothetical protein